MQNYIDFVNLVDDDVLDQELNRRNFVDRNALLEYRFDPFRLSNFVFYQHFRFCKERVHQLVDLLYPNGENQNNRGLPYTPTQKVCFILNLLGGNNFLRIGGLIGGASKSTMHNMLYDVIRQCQRNKPDVLYLPTQEMIDENARLIFKKYKTIFVIKFLRFKCNDYSCRNLDMQCNVPGSFHNATSWRLSVMKPYLEALDPKAVVLGDSAFPLSDTMITHMQGGITIERFSIFNLRYDFENVMSVVEMCGVLHNLSVI